MNNYVSVVYNSYIVQMFWCDISITYDILFLQVLKLLSTNVYLFVLPTFKGHSLMRLKFQPQSKLSS